MGPRPPASRFSIDELSTLAGVTARTVRFYIAEGVLDRPEGEKRGAHYLDRHLQQLIQLRRWVERGLSLERIRELRAGASDDPPPRPVRAGTVEVWSHVTLADGLELQIEPGRAGLTPEQVRSFVGAVQAAYRQVRQVQQGQQGQRGHDPAPTDPPG